MSFGRRPRREAKAAWEAHNRDTKPKLIAHMKDGTSRVVPTLLEYEKLRQSGEVIYFGRVEE